ncbi:MAG: acyl-CoA dehydrogenase family protein [Acidisphaera sp.]|nr:acyl-CoA dehydrogenase family protein [Acidisphaera sp.]
MDFDLTDEQRLLADSVGRLMGDAYGSLEKRRAHAAEPHGWSERVWAQYAELGLLGLPFAERHGGFGGGAVELMIVMEAFGRGLALEPYLATVVLGGGLLRLAGSEAKQARLVPRVADGSLKLAFAHGEAQARYDLDDVATTARRAGDGWRLDGAKSVVLHGDCADLLVVSARTGGERRDRDGITLFLVEAGVPGVSRRGYPTQDGQRAAEILLEGVELTPDAVLGPVGGAAAPIRLAVDAALAALSAEAVGAMDALHALTLEYLKTRKQFGVTIGSFQVLQHRAVDMVVAIEQARSMAMYATMMAGTPEGHAAVAGAKVQVNRSARFVGQQSIQLHGGIGMTMEYLAGHYFKRLTIIESLFGDTEHHLREVTASGGLLGDLPSGSGLAK